MFIPTVYLNLFNTQVCYSMSLRIIEERYSFLKLCAEYLNIQVEYLVKHTKKHHTVCFTKVFDLKAFLVQMENHL